MLKEAVTKIITYVSAFLAVVLWSTLISMVVPAIKHLYEHGQLGVLRAFLMVGLPSVMVILSIALPFTLRRLGKTYEALVLTSGSFVLGIPYAAFVAWAAVAY